MLDRLQYVKQRFDEISDLIIQPDVIADQKRYVQLNKEYKGSRLQAPTISSIHAYQVPNLHFSRHEENREFKEKTARRS
jgi:protein subunit release factor A